MPNRGRYLENPRKGTDHSNHGKGKQKVENLDLNLLWGGIRDCAYPPVNYELGETRNVEEEGAHFLTFTLCPAE